MRSLTLFLLLFFLAISSRAQVTQTFDGDFCTGEAACWGVDNYLAYVVRSPHTTGTSICTGATQNTTTPITGTGSLNRTYFFDDLGGIGIFLNNYTDTFYSTASGADGDTVSFKIRFNQLDYDTTTASGILTFRVNVQCGAFVSTHLFTTADVGSTITYTDIVSSSGGGGPIQIIVRIDGFYGVDLNFGYDLDDFSTNAILDPTNTCFDVVLPLELAAFSGKATAAGNALRWITTDDHTCPAFEVQRRQPDGAFTSIGTVASKRSVSGATYQLTDPAPASGEAYYRLKLLDDKARPTYSRIIGVVNSPAFTVSLYPNPVADRLTVSGLAPLDRLEAVNALGQVVVSQVAAHAQETLDLTGLPAAMYTLVVTSAQNKQRTIRKVTKQ